MRCVAAAWLLLLSSACATMSESEYLATELALVRPGVDLASEEREVRRVLLQRHMDVVSELRGPGFVALGAESLDAARSAVRVIAMRGVVVAEDAAADDLFAPSHVSLLADFGPRFGQHLLVAVLRKPARADQGCVTIFRLLPDAALVRAGLDVSALGARACVGDVAMAERGRLRVTIAWPGLTALSTPTMHAELTLAETPLGRPAPRVPVFKLDQLGPWVEAERTRLSAQVPPQAPFSQRHAVGVARAAVEVLAGGDLQKQLAAYQDALGTGSGESSFETEVRANTMAHIQRGWLDPDELAAPGAASEPDSEGADDVEVIEPPTAAPERAAPH